MRESERRPNSERSLRSSPLPGERARVLISVERRINSSSLTDKGESLGQLVSKGIEHLRVMGCSNVDSIDLSCLDGSPTLQAIDLMTNTGWFDRLVLPSGCPHLRRVVITGNTGPWLRWDEQKLSALRLGRVEEDSKPNTLSIGWRSIPTRVDSKGRVWIDEKAFGLRFVERDGRQMWEADRHIMSSERESERRPERLSTEEWRLFWRGLGMPDPDRHVRDVIDLSALDVSPSLRFLKVTGNVFGAILPSRCPNLEMVVLSDTKVVDWRLEECPELKLIMLETPGRDSRIYWSDVRIDLGPLPDRYRSLGRPPIIYIEDWRGLYLEHILAGYEGLPERVKSRLIMYNLADEGDFYQIGDDKGEDLDCQAEPVYREYARLAELYGE